MKGANKLGILLGLLFIGLGIIAYMRDYHYVTTTGGAFALGFFIIGLALKGKNIPQIMKTDIPSNLMTESQFKFAKIFVLTLLAIVVGIILVTLFNYYGCSGCLWKVIY